MSENIGFNGLKVVEGSLPVLISAPHTHPHLRPNLTGVYKGGEGWLDLITESLCKKSQAFGIYSVGDLEYDPNFSSLGNNEYKAEVASMIKRGKIKYFIDLHGLSDIHQYDFAILYPNRYLKSKNLAYKLASAINKGGLRGALIQTHNLFDGNGETLSHFVAAKMKTASVQIEIARYIREDVELRSEFISNISSVLAVL